MAYQDPIGTTMHSGSGTFGGGLGRNVTHPSSSYQDPTSATTHSGSGTFGGGLSRNVTHPSSRANMYPGLSHQGRAQENVRPQEVLNLKGSG